MPLKNKLKLARNSLGKTQLEMAKALGISKRGWQTYEEGRNTPGGKIFEKLSELGFNVTWFFNDDVSMMLEDATLYTGEQSASYAAQVGDKKEGPREPHMPSDELGLGESVELLAKIYNSGNTVLVRAIAANLHAFSEAVDNKAMAQKAIDMMEEMNKRVLTLEKDLAKLKEENEQLKKKPPGESQQAIG